MRFFNTAAAPSNSMTTAFFDRLRLRAPLDEATGLLLAGWVGGTSSADQGLQRRAPGCMIGVLDVIQSNCRVA